MSIRLMTDLRQRYVQVAIISLAVLLASLLSGAAIGQLALADSARRISALDNSGYRPGRPGPTAVIYLCEARAEAMICRRP